MGSIPLSQMSRTDIIPGLAVAAIAGLCFFNVVLGVHNLNLKNRINAQEVRLQNVEHLLSLSLSESRSSASNSIARGVPASTNETRERIDAPLQRRVKRKSGHYPPAHDRRTEGE